MLQIHSGYSEGVFVLPLQVFHLFQPLG
jgi:hypothetical protein